MFIPRLAAVIFSSSFLLLGSAFGQKATIDVGVKGVDGAPAKGAEIRIERQDKKAAPVIAKTDRGGRAIVNNLEVGSYKVTATVEGRILSSQIVKAQAGKALPVAFDMRKTVAVTSKAKKRHVWVEPQTGSHLGGHWEDQDIPNGPYVGNLDTMKGEAINRFQQQLPPPSTGAR